MVLHVRGTVLPEREARTLWIDGGVLREDPVAGADTVADGGWLLPGLVDVHTHPGAERPGDPFDESVLRSTSPTTPPRASCWSAHPGPRPASRAGPTTRRACPGSGPRDHGWPRRAGSSRAGDAASGEAGLARAAVEEAAAALEAAQAAAPPARRPEPPRRPARRQRPPPRRRAPPPLPGRPHRPVPLPQPAGARSSATGPGTSRRCRWPSSAT